MTGSLSDVCFEQIADEYWYGLYGSFKLIINRNTGCFNATKLCQEGGKRFHHWLRNKESKRLIEHYRRKHEAQNPETCFIQTIAGGNQNNVYNAIISGTYLPKQLILSVGFWISLDFHDRVFDIVDSYFRNEFDEKYKNDMCQMQTRLQQINLEMEHLRLENERHIHEKNQIQHEKNQIQHVNEQIQHEKNQIQQEKEQIQQEKEQIQQEKEQIQQENHRYRTFEEDIAFKTIDWRKLHMFALIRKNCFSTNFPLYVVRTQRGNYETTIAHLSRKYPDMQILFELGYNPNAINLFNRVKERVENIYVRYNDIRLLNDYTEEQLVRDVQRIADLCVASITE